MTDRERAMLWISFVASMVAVPFAVVAYVLVVVR